ncbi:MAG: aspartate kinase [Spirochaetes bacterium]|nr:MAG: aspartate kinase [Spirochaetota bacterium]
MRVEKFGGSSLADSERIKNISSIILNSSKKEKIAVILSAMKGVTDSLIRAAQIAEEGNSEYTEDIENIREKHLKAVRSLFAPKNQTTVITHLQLMFNELEDILHGVELVRECSKRTMDLVMSFGERMSCTLVTEYLNTRGCSAKFIDARNYIKTDNRYGSAVVDFAKSYALIKNIGSLKAVPIITGFIASTENGITTTLGRNGSDYTASIFGAALEAECIEIWTDVDGVMSADPRFVRNAFVIPELSYQEAMELSYFGAEVLHPYTMIPAIEKGIPIRIKNSLNPSNPGTLILNKLISHPYPITGIASIDSIALLNIEGGGMIGIPGIAARIFHALAKEAVNIMMISQASSEHSICLVFHETESKAVVNSLHRELALELETKRVENFELKKDLVMIAIIGENMRGTPGISGKLFSALGREEINVFAIAQGSSERNISFIISKKDEKHALGTIHRAFLENGTDSETTGN